MITRSGLIDALEMKDSHLEKKPKFSLFHRHQWKTLSETTTESPMESFQRLGGTNIKTGPGVYTDPVTMFYKKHILIVTCDCGKIKRFVTDL